MRSVYSRFLLFSSILSFSWSGKVTENAVLSKTAGQFTATNASVSPSSFKFSWTLDPCKNTLELKIGASITLQLFQPIPTRAGKSVPIPYVARTRWLCDTADSGIFLSGPSISGNLPEIVLHRDKSTGNFGLSSAESGNCLDGMYVVDFGDKPFLDIDASDVHRGTAVGFRRKFLASQAVGSSVGFMISRSDGLRAMLVARITDIDVFAPGVATVDFAALMYQRQSRFRGANCTVHPS